MHTELIFLKHIYDVQNIDCRNIQEERESTEYAASTYRVGDKRIVFRSAKITPSKTGQFVAIWKREINGITAPFDAADAFDFFVISTREHEQIGHFIFSKAVLIEQGIISNGSIGGKRGMRLYSPWHRPDSKQAQKTQTWQCNYFIDFSNEKEINTERLVHLLSR